MADLLNVIFSFFFKLAHKQVATDALKLMVFDQGNASKCLDCKLFAGAPYLVHLVVSLFRHYVRNNNK